MDVMKEFEAKVDTAVEKYAAKHSKFVLDTMQEMAANDKLPPTLTGIAFATVLTDALAKVHAMLATTLGTDLEQTIQKAKDNLGLLIRGHYAEIGEHNVHANPVGQTLPPDKPTP